MDLLYQLEVYHNQTFEHCRRVANISRFIGKSIKLNARELTELNTSALLHDLGKINVPIKILDKPSTLTAAEWAVMKNHPTNAINILKAQQLCFPDSVYMGILAHHERFDGTGYPLGLKGEDIPLFGRIIALADAWDAMTSPRSYKAPLSINAAVDEVYHGLQMQFDPYIVKRTVALQAELLIGA